MSKTIAYGHLPLGLHNKNEYINEEIKDISQLGYVKKKRAKKAISWLLSKAPHSVPEIADHFDMSPELVKGLLEELMKANLVVRVPGSSNKYNLESKNLRGSLVYKSIGKMSSEGTSSVNKKM
ncbi:MAG: hypothetical protein M0Z31_09255 [Clostridia bacterium]|nr:hypothetical protein [Clostridia bacterium]